MEETLAEIEFLALSPNRVTVLESLAGGPRTRSELAEETGASQATLGRILGDFEDRDWVARTDGAYAATATGRLVAEGFRELLDVMATERDLRDVVAYLPTEAMDFDLRHLADATIVTPTETRPNAPLQRLLALMRRADSVTAFSHALNDQSLAVVADRLGEQEFEAVLTRGAVDSLTADDTLRERLRRVVTAPAADIRVTDDDIPVAVTVVEDVVTLLVRDDRGVVQAAVATSDPAIREWAERRYEQYRSKSTPLTADDIDA
jgi:predicted transcriptional regulator